MSFEKISLEEWKRFNDKRNVDLIPELNEFNYNRIVKPKRSTKSSAGYDFYLPFDIDIKADQIVVLPTGIKANLDNLTERLFYHQIDTGTDREEIKHVSNTYLQLHPRSSLGIKHGFRLLNTTGIIDKDYYNNPDNEGHILVGFTVSKDLKLEVGSKICQGIISYYLIMEDDNAPNIERSGGIGSTGK